MSRREARRINQNKTPPHKLIDEFVRWEKGDKIKITETEIGNQKCDSLIFRGADDDYFVIFETFDIILPSDKRKIDKDNLARIPPRFLKEIFIENESLQERIRCEETKNMKEQVSGESNYDQYLEQITKELQKNQNRNEV